MNGSAREWKAVAVGGGSGDGRGGLRSREEGLISVVDMTKTEICGRLRATDEFGSVTDMTKTGTNLMCFATTDEIGSVTDMTTTKNEIMSKNGNLMGFATTDEIGSVTDMTKTKNEIREEPDDVTNMKMNIYFGCNEGGP